MTVPRPHAAQPDIALRSREAHGRLLRWTVVVIALGLGLAAVASRASSFGPQDVVRNEFTQDYVSARALSDGLDPYGPAKVLMDRYLPGRQAYVIRNPHTPLQIMLVWPFAQLPFGAARGVWLLIQAAAIAGAVWLVGRGLGWSRSAALVAGVGALAIPVAQKELVYGNLNGLVLLLLALGWRALRRDGEVSAGLAIGAAAALKLLPLMLFVPLIRVRRWRSVGSMLVSGIVLTVFGFFSIGLSAVDGFRSSLAENAGFWRAAPFNVSLSAIPHRWLENTIWHRGVVSAPGAAAILAGILLVACIAAAAVTPAHRSQDVFWAALPWMVLASPLAWDWYLVLALPMIVIMVGNAVRDGKFLGLLTVLAIALVAIGIPPGLPVPGQPISPATLVVGYGLPTYALILLGTSDFLPLRSRARAHVLPEVEHDAVDGPRAGKTI